MCSRIDVLFHQKAVQAVRSNLFHWLSKTLIGGTSYSSTDNSLDYYTNNTEQYLQTF